ncbi:glycosyltransferase [bacterium]|nr:glycosyltransferase [bacterium]
MNCYNGQKYLREAIDSVLAQTYENFEIIFWDNQSTDESASIFKSYSDSRLKYFYAPTHTFLYEARNYAVKKAEGEFFAFLDVDDTWAPRKLEQQIPLFTADSEVGFVCSNYWIVQQETGVKKIFRKKKLPRGRVLNDLLLDYPVGLLTLVLRRTAFESLKRGCDPRFHVIGDMDLTVRLAMSWKMDSVQEPLAFYRLHGNNEGQKQKERQVNEFKVFVDELQKNPDVASLSGYQKISQELIYMQGRLYLLRDEKEKIRICLNQLKWGRYKIKLWILFVFKFWRLGR